jgi:hypothetical protein
MDVRDDTQYVANLSTLCVSSVRRHFNPYADIDWQAPQFSVTQNHLRKTTRAWVSLRTESFVSKP